MSRTKQVVCYAIGVCCGMIIFSQGLGSFAYGDLKRPLEHLGLLVALAGFAIFALSVLAYSLLRRIDNLEAQISANALPNPTESLKRSRLDSKIIGAATFVCLIVILALAFFVPALRSISPF